MNTSHSTVIFFIVCYVSFITDLCHIAVFWKCQGLDYCYMRNQEEQNTTCEVKQNTDVTNLYNCTSEISGFISETFNSNGFTKHLPLVIFPFTFLKHSLKTLVYNVTATFNSQQTSEIITTVNYHMEWRVHICCLKNQRHNSSVLWLIFHPLVTQVATFHEEFLPIFNTYFWFAVSTICKVF
jgi:hypothetical protein